MNDFTPRQPNFFHGRGDGSDPEDLAKCWQCGHETHRLVDGCPNCGATMQSRRWARRYGAILVVLGLALVLGVGGLTWWMSPSLFDPGADYAGTRFTGTRQQGLVIYSLLLGVVAFGFVSFCYGVWQVWTGGRSRKAVGVILALAAALYVAAWLIPRYLG